jgi:RNA-splicing ligase RtcB
VERGYGTREDLDRIEERGCMAGANPGQVSAHAKQRQQDEMGTLGSGNHYVEVQKVREVFEAHVAGAFIFVHRKDATRAFGIEHPEIPAALRPVGQPVLIAGTMGAASYTLVSTPEGMDMAFGPACHGAALGRARGRRRRCGPDRCPKQGTPQGRQTLVFSPWLCSTA